MGSDNLFKRRQEERKKRKENIKRQKSSKWLIVCEGKKTEPNYFKEAVDVINEEIDYKYKLKVEIVGMGMNTVSLVNSLDKLLSDVDLYKTATIPYEKIFIVFDKDSFRNEAFDKAISICEKRGYIALWSNQAIEFWFLLHFNYIDNKMDRKAYENKINEYFKKTGFKYEYRKNDESIFSKLCKYGSLNEAKKYAKKIHFTHINDKPSDSESCTTVYKFFECIDERLEELK